MGFCKNCGKELKEGTVFCAGCGAKVSSNTSINENKTSKGANLNSVKKESSVDFEKIGDKAKNIVNGAIDKVKGLGNKQKNNNNRLNKKVIVISISIVTVALLVIGLAYNFTIGKPENRILLGLKNIIEEKEEKYTFTLEVDGKIGVDEIDDLLEESSIEMKTYVNRKKLETNFEGALIIDEDEVLEANAGFEDETFFLEFPEVYDECFYQGLESDEMDYINDWINIYNCFEGEVFHILSKNDYRDVVVEMLEENLDKKVLTLKINDIIDLGEELLEVAEDDDKIAKDIYKSMKKIAKDLEKCEVESEEAEYFVDEFVDYVEDTDEDDFIDDFEDGIEVISNDFEELSNLGVLGNYEVEIEFDFGMFNTIDKMDITFDVAGIDIIIGIECGKGASKPDYEEDLELEDSEDELMEVLEEIEEDLMDNKKIEKLEGIDMYDIEKAMYNFEDLIY